MRLNLALLILLVPLGAPAQSGVDPGVHSVTSGGYWQSGADAGNYRVVLVNSGVEHVSSRVFVEWVREPKVGEQAPVVVASVEPELSFGRGIASLRTSLEPVSKGQVKVVLRGVVSAQPSQKVKAIFIATDPGRVTAMTANRSVKSRSPTAPAYFQR